MYENTVDGKNPKMIQEVIPGSNWFVPFFLGFSVEVCGVKIDEKPCSGVWTMVHGFGELMVVANPQKGAFDE